MPHHKTDKLVHYQMKPITTRQLALAGLFIVACGALIAFVLIKHQANNDRVGNLNPIVIPNVIKAKTIAAEPQYNESWPIVFPATRGRGN